MPRDVTPIGPEPTPSGVFPRQAPLRADNEKQGGGGQGQGKSKDPEPEPEPDEEENPEAPSRLAGDSFQSKRQGANLSQFMADKLPWELDEGARKAPLAPSRLKLPNTPQRTPANPRPGLSALPPRRVEAASDQTAALNAVLSAQHELAKRQAPPQPPAQTQPPALDARALAPEVPVPPVQLNPCACSYRVLDGATGRPVAGAQLDFKPLSPAQGSGFTVQADLTGLFASAEIPEGNYQVRAGKDGYEPQVQTRYLSADEEDMGTFLIKPR